MDRRVFEEEVEPVPREYFLNRFSEVQGRHTRLSEQINFEGFFDWNLITNEIYYSKGLKEMLGYQEGEITNHVGEWKKRLHPDEKNYVIQGVINYIRGHAGDCSFHHRLACKDGKYRCFLIKGEVTSRTLEGKPLRMVGTSLDITGQLLSGEEWLAALPETEERFRRAILFSPFPIMIHAEDGEVVVINNVWSELTGYSHEDIPTISDWTEKAYGKRKETVRESISSLYYLNDKVDEGECLITTSSGEKLTWDFCSAPLSIMPDGRRMVISMAMDVTARNKAKDALKWELKVNEVIAEVSQLLLQQQNVNTISKLILQHAKALTESEFGFVGYIDQLTGFLVCPTFTESVWGENEIHIEIEDVIFQRFQGLLGWVLNNNKPLITNDTSLDSRCCGVPDGHVPINRFVAVPANYCDELVGIVALANSNRNYTEQDLAVINRLAVMYAISVHRKRAEEELWEVYEKISAVIQSSPLAIVVLDFMGVVQSWSKSAEIIFDWQEQEVIGHFVPYVLEDKMEEFMAAFKREWSGQNVRGLEVVRKNKFGQEVFVREYTSRLHDSDGNVTGLVVLIEDITVQKRVKMEFQVAQKQAEQAMKMATLGGMLAGIAHEVSQPLNSIKMAASGMIYWFEKGHDPSREQIIRNFRDISKQTEITADIIRHMRSIIKRDIYTEKTLVDLNAVIETALNLISFQVSLNNISIVKELTVPLPNILGRISAMELVLANLLQNAIQAFRYTENKSWKIKCSTHVEDNRVILEVSDNATGITKEAKQKLFEPFFTTKKGEGMGLGLFIVQSTVENCQGQIQIINNDEGGATIRVEFPIAEPDSVGG